MLDTHQSAGAGPVDGGLDPRSNGDPTPSSKGRFSSGVSFPVACVAASAGGENAVVELLRQLPGDTLLSLVLVYRPDRSSSALTEHLARESRLPVIAIEDSVELKPGHAYVMPHGAHAEVSGGRIELTRTAMETGNSTPADALMRSLARDLRANCVGVVLSGTGSDGALGLRDIKAEGGITLAEDPRNAACPSMPRSAIATDCVDFALDLCDLAAELSRIGRASSTAASARPGGGALVTDHEIGPLTRLLHSATGVDFTHYRKNTLKRRIQRRLVLRRLKSVQEYLHYIESHPQEIHELYQDLLIAVTAFFRDPDAFAAIKTRVFPVLMHKRPADAPLRIWVPGCATGEEVYSLAISLLEFLADDADGHAIQIFGTDLSEPAVQRARAGTYIENISIDVSQGRLRRFFTRTEAGFQINKTIRDLCIFSRHNVATDPPFSKVDLISCRNLLIYLEPSLQRRLLHTFHHALKPTGFLMLGASEGTSTLPELFGIADKTHKIYCKKPAPSRGYALQARPSGADDAASEPPAEAPSRDGRPEPDDASGSDQMRREADRIVMANYAPAGVVIDEGMQIVQFRGKTGAYLEPAPGEASLHLFRMARDGLLPSLRAAVQAAMASGSVARRTGIASGPGDEARSVDIEVWPLKARLPQGRCFLVIFAESSAPAADPSAGPAKRSQRSEEPEVAQLQRELAATKEYLQSIIEELEATNEELKSANEEIISSNEELHTINDELEVAKNELLSTNEELSTVNEELRSRNLDLGLTNDDLRNILNSVSIPIVLLGADLSVRRCTKAAERLLGLTPSDIGRPFTEIRPRLSGQDVAELAVEVLDLMSFVERHVRDEDGCWYLMRIRPYRTVGNKIDGAVLSWISIDAQKRAEQELAHQKSRLASLFMVLREPVLLLDHELRVAAATKPCCDFFHVAPSDIEGRPIAAANVALGARDLVQRLKDVLNHGAALVEHRVDVNLVSTGRKTLLLSASRLEPATDHPPAVVLSLKDVTGA